MSSKVCKDSSIVSVTEHVSGGDENTAHDSVMEHVSEGDENTAHDTLSDDISRNDYQLLPNTVSFHYIYNIILNRHYPIFIQFVIIIFYIQHMFLSQETLLR